jgi:hypothetical protein
MKFKITNRQYLFFSVTLFYLLPLVFFAGYSVYLLPRAQSWNILSIGLLLLATSSLLLFLLLYYWEQSFRLANDIQKLDENLSLNESSPPYSAPIFYVEEKEVEINLFKNQIKELESEKAQYLQEISELSLKTAQMTQEISEYRIFSEEQIKQKNIQLSAMQINFEEQQNEIKHQQDHMEQLHGKVKDLSYEIKTLLSVGSEKENPLSYKELPTEEPLQAHTRIPLNLETRVQNKNDAIILLKKCINITQKITGAYYYGNELSRYREFSYSHSAIDLRRLFDSLRMENEAVVVVYSPKEHKLLFANQQIKSALGWSPDKFAQDFLTLMPEHAFEWKNAVNSLSNKSETYLRVILKSKTGQDTLVQCHLGVIPTGLFRQFVIGVLFIPDQFSA